MSSAYMSSPSPSFKFGMSAESDLAHGSAPLAGAEQTLADTRVQAKVRRKRPSSSVHTKWKECQIVDHNILEKSTEPLSRKNECNSIASPKNEGGNPPRFA